MRTGPLPLSPLPPTKSLLDLITILIVLLLLIVVTDVADPLGAVAAALKVAEVRRGQSGNRMMLTLVLCFKIRWYGKKFIYKLVLLYL